MRRESKGELKGRKKKKCEDREEGEENVTENEK